MVPFHAAIRLEDGVYEIEQCVHSRCMIAAMLGVLGRAPRTSRSRSAVRAAATRAALDHDVRPRQADLGWANHWRNGRHMLKTQLCRLSNIFLEKRIFYHGIQNLDWTNRQISSS